MQKAGIVFAVGVDGSGRHGGWGVVFYLDDTVMSVTAW